MISLSNGTILIPNAWNELSPRQFADIARCVWDYCKKDIDIVDFRLMVLKALTGYTRSGKRFSPDEQEQINGNLLILSEMIDFVVKPVYDQPEILEILSPDLQEKLKTRFPFEIYDLSHHEELDRVASMLKYHAGINYDIRKNPIRTIDTVDRTFYGPTFNVDALGILETDLIAGEYLDAREYLLMFERTGDSRYLANLAGVLFRPVRDVYTTFWAQENSKQLAKANENELLAVWLLFSAWQRYFINHPHFGILFTGAERNNNKIDIGASETLYSMSKDGYGSLSGVTHMNIVDYFNIQVKNIKDAVCSLRAAGKKNGEIADMLKLPIDTILKL